MPTKVGTQSSDRFTRVLKILTILDFCFERFRQFGADDAKFPSYFDPNLSELCVRTSVGIIGGPEVSEESNITMYVLFSL